MKWIERIIDLSFLALIVFAFILLVDFGLWCFFE